MFNNIFQKSLQRTRETFFKQVVGLFDRESIDDDVWDELEELLISADVGIITAEKLITRTKEAIAEAKIRDGNGVRRILQQEMVNLLQGSVATGDAVTGQPHVVMVVGVNGSGKTTSIAKLSRLWIADGKKVLLAAADTFRAAASDQLRALSERVGADIISQQPNADPGAVAYDALQAAASRKTDIVVIDTAGRLHTKFNLMAELQKIKRVTAKFDETAPHEVLLVLDATTGQNGLQQAIHFNQAVGVTGIFLTKLDSTAKGGIVLAIADQLKIPILYVGLGDDLDAIAPFDAGAFVSELCS